MFKSEESDPYASRGVKWGIGRGRRGEEKEREDSISNSLQSTSGQLRGRQMPALHVAVRGALEVALQPARIGVCVRDGGGEILSYAQVYAFDLKHVTKMCTYTAKTIRNATH